MMRRVMQLIVMGCGFSLLGSCAPSPHDTSFSDWVAGVRNSAIQQGIPQQVATDALADIRYDEKVVALDQKQPEDKASFTQYKANVVSARRIAKGREMLAENRELLDQISQTYHVQPQYIVALWGVESDYGAHQGNYNVIQSLATLAYEGRREEFFKGELFKALRILADNHMSSSQLTGSWAGAMGNCQFMPSSYVSYATAWRHGGFPDIWNSNADTFASIANYLHQSGWDGSQGWGAAAQTDSGDADLITPGTDDEGHYSVTSNYRVITKWNRSRMFAVSVGLLADEIAK